MATNTPLILRWQGKHGRVVQMSRRRVYAVKAKKVRSGLDLSQINSECQRLAQDEMVLTIPCAITARQAYELLVPANVRNALNAAAPYIGWTGEAAKQHIGCEVEIEFKAANVGAGIICKQLPKNNSLSTTAELLEQSDYHHLVPLLKVRDQMIVIHRKWAVVMHTLAFMDRNYSAKVIRSLCPCR